jgi:hypothetical protein
MLITGITHPLKSEPRKVLLRRKMVANKDGRHSRQATTKTPKEEAGGGALKLGRWRKEN